MGHPPARPATGFAWPLGPRLRPSSACASLLGLAASWLGTLLWNRASHLLPAALVGQLIVFETLAALLYAFLWYGRWPGMAESAGIAADRQGARRRAGVPPGAAPAVDGTA